MVENSVKSRKNKRDPKAVLILSLNWADLHFV
jgi:hypothetical protein